MMQKRIFILILMFAVAVFCRSDAFRDAVLSRYVPGEVDVRVAREGDGDAALRLVKKLVYGRKLY